MSDGLGEGGDGRRRPRCSRSSGVAVLSGPGKRASPKAAGANTPHDGQARVLPSAWTSLDTAGSMQEAQDALETYRKKDPNKVVVRFKAVGNAPIMKQNFYKITASNRFQAVIQFLRKELGWKAGDPLFTYINLAFSPAPDDTVTNLFKSFATDGHLIVNYSTTAAWG
ncbi:ubiquitin-like autophagy protein Apg12-domain-containing protein [Rhodofomes roseus]|uniref:Ubiquitin-like protein ATG12 n=1 Tax=Rhodofomes roseus TaxID=34475 RepID=A0ABQ8JZK8_9APHY|nr:ubiquitin-like autophagy protein Apg12-domain-containing protein [Rhodofomes roseus]KAH9829824.1 ubiquitin-like autophagy protein Apg12-domain-containing protein [Rhodofomes roseus]